MPSLAWQALEKAPGTMVPKEPAIGLYTHGFVHGPGLPRLPWTVAANGTTQSGTSRSLIAKATVPCVPFIWADPGEEDAKAGVRYLADLRTFLADFKRIMPVVTAKHVWGSTLEEVKTGVIQKISRDKIWLFATPQDLCFGVDQDWLTDKMLRVQQYLTLLMSSARIYPTMKYVGYGLIERANGGYRIKEHGRPKSIIDYANGDARVRISPIDDKFGPRELRDQCTYLYPCAMAFQDLFGRQMPFLSLYDWVALVNTLAGNYKGYGDISIVRKWTASDITAVVSSLIGSGITMANPLIPPWTDVDGWAKYFRAMVLFGFLLARTMGTVTDIEFFKIKGSMLTEDTRWEEAMRPNLEAWGSSSTPYYIMPYNKLEAELPVPMIIDMSEEHGYNIYKRNSKYIRTFQTVTVDRGEHQAFDPTSETTVHIRPVIMNDARQELLVEGAWKRETLVWRFPRARVLESLEDMGLDARWDTQFFWMLKDKQSTLKHGYMTGFTGWVSNVDTLRTETDVMWEMAVKGLEEQAALRQAGPSYTKDAKQIKTPKTVEEQTRTAEFHAIPVEVKKALDTGTGEAPTPITKTPAPPTNGA